MATTSTRKRTLADALNTANHTDLATALRKVRLGRILTPNKITTAGLTAASSFDITTFKKGDSTLTINQGLDDLATGENLPPILSVVALRVTAGAAQAGPRVVMDSGGTAAASATGIGGAPGGSAKLSDDGKTITFEANVTGFVLEYIPRSFSDVTAAFPPG